MPLAQYDSLRANPFHTQGKVIDRPLTDPSILAAAGLNWTAEEIGLYRTDLTTVTTHKAIVRSDDKRQLGIVGKGYQPLQNADLFGFFRDIAGIGELTVESAGHLKDGQMVWALARIPGLELAKGEDFSKGYMLIRNSHDGSSTLRVVPTMIRVRCSNQFRMVEREVKRRAARTPDNLLSRGYCIRHTEGMKEALHDIADAYARTMANYEATRAAFSALTSKPLSDAAFVRMMNAAFNVDAEAVTESERSKTMAKNREDKVRTILASPTCNVPGTAGTLWAGLNAVTEYLDHEAPARAKDGRSDAAMRFASTCFDGNGDKAKGAAFSTAMALV